jgi:hypothetical protein
MRAFLVFGVVALTSGAVAFADQSPVKPQATTQFGALRPAQSKDPYRKLFDTQTALKAALAQQLHTATSAPAPKVVCGMTLIPANPTIDPKMMVEKPRSDGTKYTIRAVDPPICNSSASR